MKLMKGKALLLSVAPLLLVGATALGGDGVVVKVTNDGTQDIVVTVYDKSVGPSAVVLSNTHITGFTTVPISVTPDATGRANLAWTAVTTDANGRKCGHADNIELSDSSSLNVHADSSCT